MMSIVRNLAGHVPAGVAGQGLARLGQQSSAAMSSRSWIVQDNTPFMTSTTPLSRRKVVEVPKPAEGLEEGGALPAQTKAAANRWPVAKKPGDTTEDGTAADRTLPPTDSQGVKSE